MMEWIGLGILLPLLFCGGMCVVGAVLAFFGIRRATDSTRGRGSDDEWAELFDTPPEKSPLEKTGDHK